MCLMSPSLLSSLPDTLLQCGTLISMKELCLEVSGFVLLKFCALVFLSVCPSPQVHVRDFNCNVKSGFENVLTCCHCLFLKEKQEEDQAIRKANINLQVRKTSVM